ncbi:MAG TPA: aminoglycoside phosphotransferase family protein [Mycobacteriales bacterium]|nr:aminoglycoside phosphotransferase family protein [Mycobacteriales bacterium]
MATVEEVRAIGNAVGVTVERRLAGGMWGAYLAHTRTGAPVVMKPLVVHPMHTLAKAQRAVQLAGRLHEDGYPIPRYLDVTALGDQVVTVQEFIAGETPEVFEVDHARQLIDLWRRHRDRADGTGLDPLAGVRSAQAPDCLTLQDAADPAIRALYAEARAVIDANDPSIFRTTDIVHHDFHHRNFLVRDGRVVAVFDWEGASGGDSRVDLCGLAWTTRPGLPSRTPEADALTAAAVAREVDPDVAAALAAGRAVEKLAFGLRSGAEIRDDVLAAVRACMRPHW